MSSLKKKIFILAIILLVLGGLFTFFLFKKSHSKLVLYGNVDIRDVNVAFRVGGRLKGLTVDEGSVVHKGDVLGTLDNEPMQNNLKIAKADLDIMEAQNSIYHKGYRTEEVDQARSSLEAHKVTLANAEQQYKRQKKLVTARASSQKTLDDAKAQRDQEQAQYNAALSQYRLMTKGFRSEEIEQSVAKVDKAKASFAAAQLNLEDATLKSPVDGVVMTRAVEPGSMVLSGTSIFTVSLLRPIWVRAYASENVLGEMILGRHVQVHQDTNPNKIYDGVIGFVSPTAEFTPKSVETTDLRTSLVYRLRIIIQNPDNNLLQGMPVTITF